MNYSPIKRGEGVERRGIFLTPSAYSTGSGKITHVRRNFRLIPGNNTL
jgi:hypothetical protein